MYTCTAHAVDYVTMKQLRAKIRRSKSGRSACIHAPRMLWTMSPWHEDDANKQGQGVYGICMHEQVMQTVSNLHHASTGCRVLRHADGLNMYKSCVLCLCYHPVHDHAHLYRSIYHRGYTPRWTADHISSKYMKVPDGIEIPNPNANHNIYCVKLQKSLHGLKQSGRMWYNRLNEFIWRDTPTMMIAHVFLLRNLKRDFVLYLYTLMI
jgi:hypothetical protein